MGKPDLITIIVIAANVLMSYKGFGDYSFFEKYKFNVGAVKRGEQIRLFSSGFLHVDMQHLLFNMLTLYFFSGIVIFRLGVFGFLIMLGYKYRLSAIILVSELEKNPDKSIKKNRSSDKINVVISSKN